MACATLPGVRLLLLVGLVAAAACGGDGDGASGEADVEPAATVRVPADHPTIQAAVDAAEPGDLILVEPGVYEESVTIETPEVTLRGTDRNEVVLDGGFELDNGVRVAGANGVAVENMTARNYTSNGFFWTGVEGYRASYLTAYRIGAYGIYAFDSTGGLIEHSAAAGSVEAGFYVGQCFPCDTVLDDVLAEHNGIGYTGTNAGGDLTILDSTFRHNRVGIMPNSGTYELCFPERDTTVAGNLVHSNNQPDTPATRSALRNMGSGIVVYGGTHNLITRNRVADQERAGDRLFSRREDDPNDALPPASEDDRPCREARLEPAADPADIPGSLDWDARDNRVVGNVVSGSGLADLATATLGADPAALGNCFADNRYESSAPADLEDLAGCDSPSAGDWTAGALDLAALLEAEVAPPGDYTTTPVPAAQPGMPDAATAPACPATEPPSQPDPEAVEIPAAP